MQCLFCQHWYVDGSGKFGETIDGLLFNQEFSFPLPYNQTKVTLDQDSTDEDVIQTSIGQGKTQITPVQLNLITAAIANGGKLMQPIVVDRVLNADGKILEKMSRPFIGS